MAERINQLGGKPNFNPQGLLRRSATAYVEGEKLVDMIKENLVAERIAVDHQRELPPSRRTQLRSHPGTEAYVGRAQATLRHGCDAWVARVSSRSLRD